MTSLSVLLLLLTAFSGSAAVDPAVTQYWESRSRFEAMQRAERFDGNETLTAKEALVNATMVAMQRELRKNLTYALSTPLISVLDQVKDNPLFKWLDSMPKGAVLHLHWDSILSIDWLLYNASYRPGVYVLWDWGSPLFGQAVFAKASPGGRWKLLSDLRKGNPQDVDNHLRAAWNVCGNNTAYNPAVDPWGKFEKYFVLIGGLFHYRPVFEDYMKESFRIMVDQWRINYVEIRGIGLGAALYDLDRNYTQEETTRIFKKVSDDMQQERPGEFFGTSIIYAQYRRVAPSAIADGLQEFRQLRRSFPDFVIGYDLVGEEGSGRPLRDFITPLVEAQVEAKKAGEAPIDFYFHAGETDWIGNTTTGDNVNDAVLLGTKRIGHGLAMAKLPLAAKRAKEEGIVLEICPVSNQGLQYVLDMRDHPAATLLAQGVPMVLSNDDPAVLNTSGSLGWDWWLAFVAWDLDLASLKRFAENSIVHSGANAVTKSNALAGWKKQWTAWIDEKARELM